MLTSVKGVCTDQFYNVKVILLCIGFVELSIINLIRRISFIWQIKLTFFVRSATVYFASFQLFPCSYKLNCAGLQICVRIHNHEMKPGFVYKCFQYRN